MAYPPFFRPISSAATAFVYKGTRFAFAPSKGLTFKSGKTSVRLLPASGSSFVYIYLNDLKIGDLGEHSENVIPGMMTPKLRQIVDFGVEAWVAELAKREAKVDAARKRAFDNL